MVGWPLASLFQKGFTVTEKAIGLGTGGDGDGADGDGASPDDLAVFFGFG